MKKKLTVNTLALGNLKQRRKQYTIMIIGIILAMVLSSSMVLLMFSASETQTENNKHRYGTQFAAYTVDVIKEDDFKTAKESGLLADYGYMHNIGYAYSDENEKFMGAAVTWMDETADRMYYLTLLEGRKPTAKNEIAIEKNVLKKLGYKDSKIGDTIKLKLDVANGTEFGETVDKEYTIIGIYDDRKEYVGESYSNLSNDVYDSITSGIYVAPNTPVELGGKELLIAMLQSDENARYYSQIDEHTYKGELATFTYFNELTDDCLESRYSGYTHIVSSGSLDNLFNGGDLMAIVIFVLIFASCVAIVNAFNTNLKERKKQIGLLRAIGTTKRQIINIFGREAFIISLIATPISVLISYGIVRGILAIIGNGCIMTNSIWSLFASAIANIIVVMLAALVPLVVATRVTPMQAIRNTDRNRKAKNMKIKSKTSFAPASHLANRSMKFYKGGAVAVSVLLTITICFSCVAFSYVTHEMENVRVAQHDYILEHLSGYDDENIDNHMGMTESERQEIVAKPYVKNTFGMKELNCVVEFDEIDEFLKIMDYQNYEYSGDFNVARSNDELKENLNSSDKVGYERDKRELKIKNEMVKTKVVAYDKGDLKQIEKHLTEGKIDYDKLVSGEEVILVCPQEAELIANVSYRMYAVQTLFDENVGKHPAKYESIMKADSTFKVGDELIVDIPSYSYDKDADVYVVKSIDKKKVRVGAIISPNGLGFYTAGVTAPNFSMLTTVDGMNAFRTSVPYTDLYFDVNEKVDDELDFQVKEDMSKYTDKYQGYFLSSYEEENWQNRQNQKLLIALVAVVIIGFAICISIINNSISAQIRENKRVIGTLRAVGADQKELSKSYIYQMLSMFGWGTGIGYGLFVVILGVIRLVTIKTGGNYDFVFNPWFTLVMTVIAFILCALNVVSKVKKEMKNSIVENIREL